METMEKNRQIKFRAWDKLHGEMWYPVKPGLSGLRSCDILERFETIMQFTGLKDKNGKEIYEGDIVMFPAIEKLSPNPNQKISESNIVKFVNGGFNPLNIHYTGGFEIEIIGNIYENAELLKDEKD